MSIFINTLTPKFYVALTGTSSLISGLILIFEWWYFKKYGTSFIEQVSLNYIAPNPNEPDSNANTFSSSSNSLQTSQSSTSASSILTENNSKFDQENFSSNQLLVTSIGSQSSNSSSSPHHTCSGSNLGCTNSGSCSNLSSNAALNAITECKVWKNPMSLMRGAEYSRLTSTNNKEPLTFYDMNLSAQDHQTFFACDYDEGKADYEIMQRAWRERQQSMRLSLAHEALIKNSEYFCAFVLLFFFLRFKLNSVFL